MSEHVAPKYTMQEALADPALLGRSGGKSSLLAEYLIAKFRADTSGFVDRAAVEACIETAE